MASPNPSPDSSPNYLPPITEEELKMFHNIDRKLFTRLAVSLSREIAQAMQVVAFLLWLEHKGFAKDLILQMNSFADYIVIALFDEVVLCLKCIESSTFDPNSEPYAKGIPLIKTVTKNSVSINYLRKNRIKIINDVTRNVNNVCVRAFDDIVRHVQSSRQHSLNQVPYYAPQQMMQPSGGGGIAVYYDGSTVGAYGPNFQQYVVGPSVPSMDPNAVYTNMGIQTHVVGPSVAPVEPNIVYNHIGIQKNLDGPNVAIVNPNVVYDNLVVQTRSAEDDITESLALLNISTSDDDRRMVEDVQPGDRTIFLTFSKGYPISENEVRDFFISMIGDCIESIYMQEVPVGEQPLYAKLVLPSQSIIEAILDGRSKAKFSINGKHVWARKYVRKNPRSANSPPSQPSSPVAN